MALLALAALIASFGLYQDSTASIIGAMVVAPLGGAIMAFAAALVTGRTRWQGITLLQIGLGALMVVVTGFVVSLFIPDPLTLPPAIEARTHPGILDLGVALAAGAAGAWVAARRTGSDALPGVAIAVSLVPPLATVGICLELGRTSDAVGALTLFLTNLSAIVVVACIVFVAFGNAPSREQLRERHRLRNGFALALVLLCVVSVPLFANGAQEIRTTVLSTTGAPLVRAWIGSRNLQVSSWTIDGDQVAIVLEDRCAGSGGRLARSGVGRVRVSGDGGRALHAVPGGARRVHAVGSRRAGRVGLGPPERRQLRSGLGPLRVADGPYRSRSSSSRWSARLPSWTQAKATCSGAQARPR